MPELPEVETVRRGLEPHITGKRIDRVQLNRPDLRIPFPQDLMQVLTGSTVLKVGRRAKYLLFYLDNGQVILAHLGMSGQMVLGDANAYQARPHDHLLIDLEGGLRLVFHDPRRFGLVTLVPEKALMSHKLLRNLGPEPLEEGFSPEYLAKSLAKRSGALKTALMDQKLVVGVGNIYACEALFRSRVSPFVEANKAIKNSGILVSNIRNVLLEAIESGGSTLRDYVRSSGDSGYFQHHFQVYGREQRPCEVCAEPIGRKPQAGRSTFFCYKCQLVK